MRDDEAFAIAARLEAIGVEVRSATLRESSARHAEFAENGNRAMRRRRARDAKQRGRGVTRA